MGTGALCLFYGLENGVCVTGTVNDRHKNGNGKVVYHYIESFIWTFHGLNSYKV
jgi:hypothetical protein